MPNIFITGLIGRNENLTLIQFSDSEPEWFTSKFSDRKILTIFCVVYPEMFRNKHSLSLKCKLLLSKVRAGVDILKILARFSQKYDFGLESLWLSALYNKWYKMKTCSWLVNWSWKKHVATSVSCEYHTECLHSKYLPFMSRFLHNGHEND